VKKLKILLTVVAFVCAAGTAVFAATYNECRCNLGNSAGFGDNNASICCPLASTTSLTTSYAALNPDKCCALQPGKTWDNNSKTCKDICPSPMVNIGGSCYGPWTAIDLEGPGLDVTSGRDTCNNDVNNPFTCAAGNAGKSCTDYQLTVPSTAYCVTYNEQGGALTPANYYPSSTYCPSDAANILYQTNGVPDFSPGWSAVCKYMCPMPGIACDTTGKGCLWDNSNYPNPQNKGVFTVECKIGPVHTRCPAQYRAVQCN